MNNSALRTLYIFEYIAKSEKPLGISEISRDLDIPKSSVFDIIYALNERNFVEIDNPDSKTFKIGLKAYQIGASYINKASIYKVAHPVLEQIKNDFGETVYLAVEDEGSVVYLDKVESDSPIRFTCNIGSRNLMHITGIGKAMLAGYDDETVYRITKDKFIARTMNSIMNYNDLIKHLAEIRKQGYAIDSGEDIDIVRCIAAPIRDSSNKVIAAISVSMVDSHFIDERLKTISRSIINAALEISHKMGYLMDKLYI